VGVNCLLIHSMTRRGLNLCSSGATRCMDVEVDGKE